ncbi:MAG: ABC transporter ATP-binding protein [Patescibacteria group bacterium]
MAKVIEVKNLSKKYGPLVAVDGINFSVEKGEIFGLLGENGAGKTTTLEMIEGLRKPSSGEIKVLGHDSQSEIAEIKNRIGVQLQSSAYFSFLNLREILDLFGGFYPKRIATDELLSMVRLREKSKDFVGNLSGGQKQRFSIIASLINDPDVVFLDEPTTGLDPLARRNLWDIILKIKSQGKTIILTTHYMEEAEKLCDRIAIMERGKILAIGTVHELILKVNNPFRIQFVAAGIPANIEKNIRGCCGEFVKFDGKTDHYELQLKNRKDLKTALSEIEKINYEDLLVTRASLEELFIELTGKAIEDEEANA